MKMKGGYVMPNYQKMYLTMFRAATDALEVAVEDDRPPPNRRG